MARKFYTELFCWTVEVFAPGMDCGMIHTQRERVRGLGEAPAWVARFSCQRPGWPLMKTDCFS